MDQTFLERRSLQVHPKDIAWWYRVVLSSSKKYSLQHHVYREKLVKDTRYLQDFKDDKYLVVYWLSHCKNEGVRASSWEKLEQQIRERRSIQIYIEDSVWWYGVVLSSRETFSPSHSKRMWGSRMHTKEEYKCSGKIVSGCIVLYTVKVRRFNKSS